MALDLVDWSERTCHIGIRGEACALNHQLMTNQAVDSDPTIETSATTPERAVRPTPAGWTGTIGRLDRIISDAARAYLQALRGRDVVIDPAGWTRELDRLTHGRPLDYGRPGLPLMYALRYMPRRVISLIGALEMASPNGPPQSVADVGSGTGAAVVAAQLLHPSGSLRLTGLDASREMVEFARHTQAGMRLQATFDEGTIESMLEEPSATMTSDFVTFSAPFDRAFAQWEPLAAALDAGAARLILGVEPESRAFLLDGFENALRQHGWQTRRSGSSDIPEFMRREQALPGLTRLWRQLGSPGNYQPQTWWEPPADAYLIASRVADRVQETRA